MTPTASARRTGSAGLKFASMVSGCLLRVSESSESESSFSTLPGRAVTWGTIETDSESAANIKLKENLKDLESFKLLEA